MQKVDGISEQLDFFVIFPSRKKYPVQFIRKLYGIF